MRHVNAIRKIVEAGQRQEALKAIDDLLTLGPGNMEALKLKALLYAAEGRYHEEALVWHRVLQVDNEDIDGIEFLLKQQNEDREHFYFTDPIPTGGRRYLAYPRQLFYAALIGLLGCLSFLFISRMGSIYPQLTDVSILLSAFVLLVVGPWLAIVYGWARSLKSLIVYPQGIIAETRFRKFHFGWQDLQKVAVAFSGDAYEPRLSLVILLKDSAQPAFLIDLSDASSALRARTYLLREISTYVSELPHLPLESLNLNGKTVRSY